MEWTTEPPTREGWYWVLFDDGLALVCLRIRVLESSDLYNGDYNLDHVTHWLGPIPAPEPPKE